MSGIPIHTSSPISATKADGVSPHTRAPEAETTSTTPRSIPATATSTASSSSAYHLQYPAPAPVQAPAPAPTSSVSHSSQQPHATPTRTLVTPEYDTPPAPQPGAAPSPFTTSNSAKTSLPPPPKVGETPKPPEYYAPVRTQASNTVAPPQPYPPQMSLPPPTSQNPRQPYSSTSTSNAPSSSYPASVPGFETQPQPTRTIPTAGQTTGGEGRRPSLEHPQGYVQNPYASDMTPDQRFAAQQTGSYNQSENLGYQDRGANIGGFGEEGGGSMWDTAKKWAKIAGDKASEVESDVWKRINK